jgi:alanyl-tRNA synthetase
VEEETSVVALLPDLQRRTMWLSISPCPFYGMAGGQVGDRGATATGFFIIYQLSIMHYYLFTFFTIYY